MDQIQTFNTIKNVFAALGAKTADNNYAVPLLNKTNASPQGFMDMASLASVLGVVVWDGEKGAQSAKIIGSFNNYTQTGIFRFNAYENPITNKPASDGNLGVCLILNLNTTYGLKCWQIAFVRNASQGIYIRDGKADNTWSEWFKM